MTPTDADTLKLTNFIRARWTAEGIKLTYFYGYAEEHTILIPRDAAGKLYAWLEQRLKEIKS